MVRHLSKVYLQSILSLGLMFLALGVLLLVSSWLIPPERVQLIHLESDRLKRCVLFILGAIHIPIGIGLVCAKRWAWVSMLIYAIVSTASVVGTMSYIEFVKQHPAYWEPAVAFVLSSILIVGLYYVTKPEFQR